MIEYRTMKQGVMIGIWLGGERGNIILASGMPQLLDKYHPFVQQVYYLGYNLFVPRYLGTYESSREFSVKNCVTTIERTIGLVASGKSKELYRHAIIRWNTNPPCLIGFSFGALISLMNSMPVSKTVLVCPFVDLKYHTKDSDAEDVKYTLKFLTRAYNNLYRFDSKKVLHDLVEIELPAVKRNLTIVRGETDKAIPSDEIDMLARRYACEILTKQGGHSIQMPDSLLRKIVR